MQLVYQSNVVRRGMLGACAASFLHGIVTAALATWQLAHWPVVVDAKNTAAENLTLQISTVRPLLNFYSADIDSEAPPKLLLSRSIHPVTYNNL